MKTSRRWALRLTPATVLAVCVVLAAGVSTPTAPAAAPEDWKAQIKVPTDKSTPMTVTGATVSPAVNTTSVVRKAAGFNPVWPVSSQTVVHTVYVSVDSVTASTTDDTNTGLSSTPAVTNLISEMNQYWNVQSEGKVSIVLGGIETGADHQSGACDLSQAFSDAAKTAFNGRFANNRWINTNTHLLVLSEESCGDEGFGSIGYGGGEMFSGAGLTGIYALPTAVHEFGHNLGFDHAGSSICDSTTSYDAATASALTIGKTGTCPTDEYGDYLDIMGYTLPNAVPGLSSAQAIAAGFMHDFTAVTPASEPATYTLKPMSSNGASGIRALQIVAPNGVDYYVEFRTDSGADASSGEWKYTRQCDASNGYTKCYFGGSKTAGEVRVLRFYDNDSHTTVEAAGTITGQSTKTRWTHLPIGQTFTSTGSGFTVTVNSSNTAGASVTVTDGPVRKTSTSLSMSVSRQAYGGQTSDVLKAVTPAINDVEPAGSVSFYAGTTRVATVTSSNGIAVYTMPKTTSVGAHAIKAVFTPSNAKGYTTSTSASQVLTVTKAPSAFTAKVHSTSVRRSAHETVAVKVTASGVSAPTGVFRIYVNGKTSVSYSVATSKRGSFTLTLPKITSTGVKTLTFRYYGTSSIAGAKDTTARINVTR